MPDWTEPLRAHLAGLRLSPAREAEIIEELSQHLDRRYEDLRNGGANEADARRLAIEELSEGGGPAPHMRGLAQAHTPPSIPLGEPCRSLLHGTWQDLRYAGRMVRRQPGFAAVIVATLAAGIAVNTLMFTIVNAAALRPLPFEDPHQIVRLRVSAGSAQDPMADLWRTRYGAGAGVPGKMIRIDGVPTTIVGVMPDGFGFPNRAQLWVPTVTLPEQERKSRGARGLDTIGRLRPGVTIDQARAELAGIATTLSERYPETNRNVAPLIQPLDIAPQIMATLVALVGAVGFVLLIACANVTNLLLARAADRARDVTLRLALGASRWRIVRQLLAESLLLAVAGGVAGLAVSYAGLQIVLANLSADAAPPSWIQFTIDRVVFAYVAALCLGSALVCGLVPSWQVSRPDLVAALNDAGRADTGRRGRRWTGAFVVAQVALALVLLTGASLTARNLAGLVRIDTGVADDELLQTAFVLRRSDYTSERRLLFFEQLDERLSSGRGIDAALASNAPMAGARVRTVRLEGQAAPDSNARPTVSLVDVGKRYFDVLGVPILAGRGLDADARVPSERVVVNERFARMHFPDQPAVGRRLLLEAPNPTADEAGAAQWMTIVGVIGNVRQRMLPSREFDPVVYRPYTAEPPQVMVVIARSASGAGAVTSFLRSQVQALDPDLPLFPVTTVEEALAQQFSLQRVFGSMLAAFAVIAILLAMGGLYGVTSYAVARRTREIGVRVALGDARRVWWAITGTTLRQIAIGVVLGTAGAAAVATVLPAMLVGTGGNDPLVFAAVAMALVTVGVTACAIPARRAMRVNPITALRYD